MKKKIISVIIVFVLTALSFMSVCADYGTYTSDDGTVYYYSENGGGVSIFDIVPEESAETLNIPSEIDGVPVRVVYHKKPAYLYDHIKSINIPDGVEEIRFTAFRSLREINIPSSVKKLREDCFSGAEALEKVTMHNGLAYIGAYCFRGCPSLESITIPDSVSMICDYAFSDCPKLAEVNWRKNADMGVYVFKNTKYLNEGSDGLLLINNDTVLYSVMGKIKTVEIPETVTKVYTEAFKDSEVEKVIWPKSIKTIEQNVFLEAKKLREIEFKGSIDKMEVGAFMGCESLTKPIIPEGVTEVPVLCFAYCTGLESADIPPEIAEIGSDAFVGCKGLKELKLNEGLEMIYSNAFSDCSELKEVSIPSTVNQIYETAFENCSSLEKLTIKGAVEIGKAAFVGTALKEENIKLADGVVYTPVKENKRYKNDPLSFLYEHDPNAVEEELHVPRQYEDEPTPRPKRTAEPTTAPTVKPTATPTAVPTAVPTEEPEKPPIMVVNGSDMSVIANGKPVSFTDVFPFIDENNRTQTPVRAIAEGMGLKVEYSEAVRTVMIKGGSTEIQLTIGSDNMLVNGETVKMDTEARIVNDRTYIPIRYVAEALGFEVLWK